MLNQLRGIFQRFALEHRHIAAPGFAVEDSHGQRVATVESVTLRGRHIHVEGWTLGHQVRLMGSDGVSTCQPTINRHDVSEALNVAPNTGFAVAQAYGTGTFTLFVDGPEGSISTSFAPISRGALRRNRIKLAGLFVLRMLRVGPALMRWITRREPAARARVKAALGLQGITNALPLNSAVLGDPPPDTGGANDMLALPVTLIVPVYNAFDLLKQCLSRVEAHTDRPWKMIVIEDGSTDPALRPWLRDWAAARADQVELVENQTNLGFIGSVNRGFERALEIGNNVVLLNTDALVPENWAGRLMAPMDTDASVASVTPLSNDAEIFSVPAICAGARLSPGQGDHLDAVAQRLSPVTACPSAPTGVGFCMGISIDWLRREPRLDTAFGRGYGEEVDWCQKQRARGARHLVQPGLFVEHRGGESFGSDEKAKLIAAHNAKISQRYPNYDHDVQAFIATDPLVSVRLVLAAYWAADCADRLGVPLPLYLAHSLGGGADAYLERRIAGDIEARGLPAIVVRVGAGQRWQIEVISARGRVAGLTDDLDFILRLTAELPALQVVYSCGVGDRDPVSLPALLLALCERHSALAALEARVPDIIPGPISARLAARPGHRHPAPSDEPQRLEFLIHDYFVVSPSYNLLDRDGVYRGPVTAERRDPAHKAHRMRQAHGNAGSTTVPLTTWQEAWGTALGAADQITTFSEASTTLLSRIYPEAASRISTIPHALRDAVPAITARPKGNTRVVAVLGNIGFQKGSAVLAKLARLTDPATDFKLMVVGNVDPGQRMPAAVHVHGSYDVEELPGLAARYGITDWLVPSIWPETFCYTVHEALATGLPTYAFDIGAQGAAVRDAANGIAVPFMTPGAADMQAHAARLHETLLAARPPAAKTVKKPENLSQSPATARTHGRQAALK